MALARILGSAAGAIDRAAIAFAQLRTKAAWSRETSLRHEERLAALAQIEAEYETDRHLAETDAFFPAPSVPTPKLRRVRALPHRGVVLDATWPSDVVPHLAE